MRRINPSEVSKDPEEQGPLGLLSTVIGTFLEFSLIKSMSPFQDIKLSKNTESS